MRVLLIGSYPYQRQQSMQRFARMLYDGLNEVGIDATLLRPDPIVGRLKAGETGLGKWLGYIDRFLIFPFILRRRVPGADVVHICDHGNAVYVPLLGDAPHVVTCHDLLGARVARGEIDGSRATWPGRRLAEAMLKGLARAQYVACDSEATRNDLSRLVPHRSLTRTAVIEIGLYYPYRPLDRSAARSRLYTLGIPAGPFLLHVGGNQWYKNRLGVLKIFDELRRHAEFTTHRLVLAGKPWTHEMRRFVFDYGLQGWALERVEVADEDLCALYSTAEALIFPSLEEGFGWPIIEAQACGCPVFASGRPAMTEVGGDAAVYFDPTRVSESAELIRRHWPERTERSRRGLDNARRFNAARMVARYIQQYENLVGQRCAGHTA